jgi:hypothetical protein
VRFLLMTGYAEPEVLSEDDLPLDAPLLAKPWTPDQLLTRVRQILD